MPFCGVLWVEFELKMQSVGTVIARHLYHIQCSNDFSNPLPHTGPFLTTERMRDKVDFQIIQTESTNSCIEYADFSAPSSNGLLLVSGTNILEYNVSNQKIM